MQKIIKLIEKEDVNGELRFSKFFSTKYHFNENDTQDLYLLEWLLTNRIAKFEGLIIQNPMRVQAFLVLRTLVSLAGYSKWIPANEFSDLFEFGIGGNNTQERVHDLTTEIANDLQLLRTRTPSPLLKELTIELNELAKSLTPTETTESNTPFGELELDPFWQFEETWESKANTKEDPRKEMISDPFTIFINQEHDLIENFVEKITEREPEEAPARIQVAPMVSTMNPEPPKRPNRIQPRVYNRTQFKEEQSKDFMAKMFDEVKREKAMEGGI